MISREWVVSYKYKCIYHDFMYLSRYVFKAFLLLDEGLNLDKGSKIHKSQVVDKRPINAPVPGRCY